MKRVIVVTMQWGVEVVWFNSRNVIKVINHSKSRLLYALVVRSPLASFFHSVVVIVSSSSVAVVSSNVSLFSSKTQLILPARMIEKANRARLSRLRVNIYIFLKTRSIERLFALLEARARATEPRYHLNKKKRAPSKRLWGTQENPIKDRAIHEPASLSERRFPRNRSFESNQ